MENLSLQDPPPQGGGPGGPPPAGTPLGMASRPPPQQQLPAQMFTTAAQLLDLTDKKLMVALRDGRKLMGILRSWDQFANLVLQSTVERIFAPPEHPPAPDSADDKTGGTSTPSSRGLYADIPRGIFLVRGENVLLLGEIDLDKDDDPPQGYDRAEPEVVEALAAKRKAADRTREKGKAKKLATLGFEGENLGEVLL